MDRHSLARTRRPGDERLHSSGDLSCETNVAEPVEEVVSILAEALLEMLVPVEGHGEPKFSDTP